MKTKLLAATVAVVAFATPALADFFIVREGPSGPCRIVETRPTDTKIVVDKNKEKFEMARDKDTKVTGELKKGSKVTVEYRITATSVEVKDAKAPAKDAKSKK